MSMPPDYVITGNGVPSILEKRTNTRKTKIKDPSATAAAAAAHLKSQKNHQNSELNLRIRQHNQRTQQSSIDHARKILANTSEKCDKVNKCFYNDSLKRYLSHHHRIENYNRDNRSICSSNNTTSAPTTSDTNRRIYNNNIFGIFDQPDKMVLPPLSV